MIKDKLFRRVPQRSNETACRVIDGEAVIIEPRSGTVNVLNKVGTRIWELADGERDMAAIAECVCAEFEVAPEQARRDVAEFFEDLRKKGWVAFDAAKD